MFFRTLVYLQSVLRSPLSLPYHCSSYYYFNSLLTFLSFSCPNAQLLTEIGTRPSSCLIFPLCSAPLHCLLAWKLGSLVRLLTYSSLNLYVLFCSLAALLHLRQEFNPQNCFPHSPAIPSETSDTSSQLCNFVLVN